MAAPKQPFFRHTPLDSSAESIRLLRLLPGSNDSEVSFNIFNTTFPIDEKYSALSYEWGEASPERIVYINNTVFHVPPNLHAFLWQLRSQLQAELPLLLWADAICIDQHDTYERNHQVKLMKRIYSEACETLVWLGEHAGNESGESALFEKLNAHITRYGNQDPCTAKGNWPALGLYRELRDEVELRDRWVVLVRRLSTLSYWRRLWVMQEIVLSTSARIFAGNCHLLDGGLPLLYMMTVITEGTLNLREAPMRNVLHVWSQTRSVRSRYKLQVWDLLKHFSFQFQCSIPHDRVYALLGVAEDGEKFQVNYDIPLAQLCLQLAVFTAHSEGYDIQIMRNLPLLLLGCEPTEPNFLAWTDQICQLWKNDTWNYFRDQARRINCKPITLLSDINDNGTNTTFTADSKKYFLDSTRALHDGFWQCDLYGTNVSLFFSGSTTRPRLGLIALATNSNEIKSELTLAAFKRYYQALDPYSRQDILLSVIKEPYFSRGQVEVRLELIIAILAAEPLRTVVRPSSNNSICLKQIWPLRFQYLR